MSSTADQLAAAAGAHTAAAQQMQALLGAFDIAASATDIGVARFATAAEVAGRTRADVMVSPATLASELRRISSVWVDPVAGNDAATGTTAATALRTINEAVARTGVGGRCEVRLLGNLHMTQAVELGRDQSIWISGVDAAGNVVRRTLTFEAYVGPINGIDRRRVRGIMVNGRGAIYCSSLSIVVPGLGSFGAYALDETTSPFCSTDGGRLGPIYRFADCEISIPASRIAQLIGGDGVITLDVLRCTFPQVSLGGLVDGVTSTSGTAANTIGRLTTNLASI